MGAPTSGAGRLAELEPTESSVTSLPRSRDGSYQVALAVLAKP